MNKQAGTMQSRAGAQPNENIIYTTTKNGKGAISTVNIGGDGDIGDLADVENSENKVYGALLTPKALLGADMDGSGLSNGGSLTEMNTTYARRIKRGQIAICSGLKTLINIFALSEGLGDKIVNNFDVKLTPIITVEDNRRDELLQTKIRNVNDIISLFNNLEDIDDDTRLKMLIEWLGNYLNQQDIVDILDERIKEIEQEEKEQEENGEVDDNETQNEPMSSGSLGSIGSRSRGSVNNVKNEPEDTTEVPTESNEESTEEVTPHPMTDDNRPQLAPQVDIADIEV